MSDKRSQRAGRSKAVAAEATVTAPGDAPAPTAPEDAPEAVTAGAVADDDDDVRSCCKDGETVLVTSDPAAEPVKYCARHLPVNLR